jgi:hypothetical protein
MNEARRLEQSCTSRLTAQVLATELTGLWRSFGKALFDPYRPERHYMRGPGPGWHAKYGRPAGLSRVHAEPRRNEAATPIVLLRRIMFSVAVWTAADEV